MSGALTDSQVDAWGDQTVPAAVPLTGDQLVRDLNANNRAIISVVNQTPPMRWISAQRTDGKGNGSQLDPYDGSTATKLDALMQSWAALPNLHIRLGPTAGGTPFQTNVGNDAGLGCAWYTLPGWHVEGAGMDLTTIQMIGSITGKRYDFQAFKTPSGSSSDGIRIASLTIDCNAAAISPTADSVNGQPYYSSGGVKLFGSNNTIEKVRCINAYGSLANSAERFALAVVCPNGIIATRNLIDRCKCELAAGTYGAPFALEGYGLSFPMKNSKVLDCWAFGNNDGLSSTNAFNTGGVNGAYLEDCEIDGCHFEDCQGAFYQDTGHAKRVRVTNNVVIRGYGGVMFVMIAPGAPGDAANSWTKTDIEILGNKIGLQNRVAAGASIGINVKGDPSSILTVRANTINWQEDGGGYAQYTPLQVQNADRPTIEDNILPEPTDWVSAVNNTLTGNTNTRINHNRTNKGNVFASLLDNDPASIMRSVGPTNLVGADQNNFACGGDHSYILPFQTDTTRNVTGLSLGQGKAGEEHVIWNNGANPLVLKHQSTSSSVGNRFSNSTGADITVVTGRQALIWWDGTYWQASLRN